MISTEPLYQVGVEHQLSKLCERLEEEVERYADLTIECAEAESQYKREYHRAILQAVHGTVSQKESAATLVAASSFHRWKIAEAQCKGTQQALIALRIQIESTRTISANVRAQGG